MKPQRAQVKRVGGDPGAIDKERGRRERQEGRGPARLQGEWEGSRAWCRRRRPVRAGSARRQW